MNLLRITEMAERKPLTKRYNNQTLIIYQMTMNSPNLCAQTCQKHTVGKTARSNIVVVNLFRFFTVEWSARAAGAHQTNKKIHNVPRHSAIILNAFNAQRMCLILMFQGNGLFLPFLVRRGRAMAATVPYYAVNLNEMLTSNRRECGQSERLCSGK